MRGRDWIFCEVCGTNHRKYLCPSAGLEALPYGPALADEMERMISDKDARISLLEQQLKEAGEALEPFANVGRMIDGPFGPCLFKGDDAAFGCAWTENGERKTLAWGDFRRAQSVRERISVAPQNIKTDPTWNDDYEG